MYQSTLEFINKIAPQIDAIKTNDEFRKALEDLGHFIKDVDESGRKLNLEQAVTAGMKYLEEFQNLDKDVRGFQLPIKEEDYLGEQRIALNWITTTLRGQRGDILRRVATFLLFWGPVTASAIFFLNALRRASISRTRTMLQSQINFLKPRYIAFSLVLKTYAEELREAHI